MKNIDARGYACPEPVLMTRRAVDEGGVPLQVRVDNRIAVGNITRWSKKNGFDVKVTETGNADFTLLIDLDPGKK